MIDTFTRDIADDNGEQHTYTITQFAARRSIGMQTRLAKTLAPLLAGLDFKGDPGGMLESAITFNGQHLVNSLLANLDEKKVEQLLLDLLAATRRDGIEITPAAFDGFYAANYGELAKAILAVIEVNRFFGLGNAGGGLTALLKAGLSLAKSPNTSSPNGPSGD
jgi:hypothetical protein